MQKPSSLEKRSVDEEEFKADGYRYGSIYKSFFILDGKKISGEKEDPTLKDVLIDLCIKHQIEAPEFFKKPVIHKENFVQAPATKPVLTSYAPATKPIQTYDMETLKTKLDDNDLDYCKKLYSDASTGVSLDRYKGVTDFLKTNIKEILDYIDGKDSNDAVKHLLQEIIKDKPYRIGFNEEYKTRAANILDSYSRPAGSDTKSARKLGP